MYQINLNKSKEDGTVSIKLSPDYFRTTTSGTTPTTTGSNNTWIDYLESTYNENVIKENKSQSEAGNLNNI